MNDNTPTAWMKYRKWKRVVLKEIMAGDDAKSLLAFPALGTEFKPKRPKPIRPVPLSNNRTERLFLL